MFTMPGRHYVVAASANSERSQEGDQGALVVRRETEPEFVSHDRASLYQIPSVTCGHVIIAQAAGIEPVLERCHRSVVLEGSAVPDAFERRDLVIACAAARLRRQERIGPD